MEAFKIYEAQYLGYFKEFNSMAKDCNADDILRMHNMVFRYSEELVGMLKLLYLLDYIDGLTYCTEVIKVKDVFSSVHFEQVRKGFLECTEDS